MYLQKNNERERERKGLGGRRKQKQKKRNNETRKKKKISTVIGSSAEMQEHNWKPVISANRIRNKSSCFGRKEARYSEAGFHISECVRKQNPFCGVLSIRIEVLVN